MRVFDYTRTYNYDGRVHSAASQDFNAENSSLGEVLEESDWDVNSDVAMATDGRGGPLVKRSLQSEKEIRYSYLEILVISLAFKCVVISLTCM